MKRIVAIILALLSLFSLSSALSESIAREDIQIILNGKPISLSDENGISQNCLLVDGLVYVPIEMLINKLGGLYEYSEAHKTIIIQFVTDQQPGNSAAKKKRVDITSDNFEDYFNISYNTSDITEGMPNFVGKKECSGNVSIRIDAKQPFDMYGINFTVSLDLYRSGKEGKISVSGTMPQSGSYTNTEEYSWLVESYLPATFDVWQVTVENAEGYIMIEE